MITDDHTIAIGEAARRKKWGLHLIHEFEPSPGTVTNGVLGFSRAMSPFGEKRVYCVVRWNIHPDGRVEFYWGHYDLTYSEMLETFTAKVGP